MKFCSYYGCGKLLPADFEGDTCPHCNHKNYSWDKQYIKDLPANAPEHKCRKCGSTEDLKYREEWFYGSKNQYSSGNEFECQKCDDEFKAEVKRQEAMNFILINPDDDEDTFYQNKEEVEKMFEEYFEDFWPEGDSNPFDDWVLLKVEKIDGVPKKKDFENRNVIQYDYEWYRVEEICDIEYEYSGDHNVSW